MTESIKYQQIIYAFGVSVGAFLTGCCIGLTGPQDHGIKGESEFANSTWGLNVWWVRACLPLSAIGFCKVAALDIERRGPMLTLKISSFVFFVAVIFYLSFFWNNEDRKDFELLFLHRIVFGLSCGFVSTALPLYVGEIAQKELRGTIGSFFYLQLTLGILISYCFLVFADFNWICVFGFFATLLFLNFVHLKPDSPLYLMKIGQEDAAKESLAKLRGKDYDAKNEMDIMRAIVKKSNESDGTLLQRLGNPVTIRALLICVGLMFLQQFSGIHVVLLETASTFKTVCSFDIRYSVVFVEAVQVLGALMAMYLVDLAGRRLLLLISMISMAIFMLVLAICFTIKNTGWTPLIMIFLFVLMFSFGTGPVPWIMLGELFPLNIKANGAFLVAGSFWLFHYLNADVYILVRTSMGVKNICFLFWIFFGILIMAVLFVFFFVPETKQKNLQEVEEMILNKTTS